MRSAFFVLVGALCNGGRFEPDWLSMPHFAPVFGAYDMVPAEVVEIFNRVFVADFADVRAKASTNRNPDPHLRRVHPNPPNANPFRPKARPGRLDMNGYLADAEKDVGKAMKQIKHTADLITAKPPVFYAIDPTAEIRGIVVTAEPHYMLNSPMFRSSLTDSGYPTVILSL